METNEIEKRRLDEMVEMIGAIASLDFSKRLQCENNDEPINVLAYGLNMIGEELENNVIKRTDLEELNGNLERFAYSIAHDIRSPLNSAMGLLDLIDEQLKNTNNEELTFQLKLLRKINLNMHSMVEGILENSRNLIRNSNKNNIELRMFFDELRADFGLNPRLGFNLIFNEMETVHFNKVAFKQLFYNLVSNSLKYSQQDQIILTINFKDEPDRWTIEFADNGKGIDSEKADKIFELLENFNHNHADSYGIGLNIVKRIVEQNNGSIFLDTSVSKGAKFKMIFIKSELSPV